MIDQFHEFLADFSQFGGPLCAIPSERVKEQLGENDTIWQIVG